jgi:peptide/nickel transport system permease protein
MMAVQLGRYGRLARQLRGDPRALVGLAVAAVMVVLALIGPYISPYDPLRGEFKVIEGPSGLHPFGTDSFGRDVLSQVLHGARISIVVGLGAATLAMVLGVILGLLAGYYGGWVDDIISRYVDLQWAFPEVILALALVSIMGIGVVNVIIAIAVAFMDDFARIVRGEVLRLREEEFVLAAKTVGMSDRSVMFGEVLPNAIGPVMVHFAVAIGLAILNEALLTFIGLGVDPSTPTWGFILSDSRSFIQQGWWLSVFPGLAIVLTVLSFNLLGDGLRDALNVRELELAA